jgi:N-methylhydantoinase A/oxoprolinase/acetone carboxylase beta subunit
MENGYSSTPNLRLGIDTGGTYTDAVLVDSSDRIAASTKALTTHHDLTIGIDVALSQLLKPSLQEVTLVSLSTTLATNAVIESRGTPVCLLLAGYSPAQVKRAEIDKIIHNGQCVLLDGGHDAAGGETVPLDLDEARRVIQLWHTKVSAFGVSGIFSVRNPSHEITLRELVRTQTDLPVTCGHELASSLNAPRRAVTVALNASLIPYIDALIRAVHGILIKHKIAAPLMVVKGDGSLISAKMALQRPVETVISGPAASVIGACHLGDVNSGIVADMGGTTTDISIVTGGRPVVSEKGTLIGNWKPMVETVQVFSIGLGGDSEAGYKGGKGLGIGPRRVIPMSLLGYRYPDVLERLQAQLAAPPTAGNNRFALQLFADHTQLTRMTKIEREAWQRLAEGPLEVDALGQSEKYQARAIATLVRRGIAIYSGFSPSDAAHVLDYTSHWSREAANLAARIWARQMRQVYGWGNFQPDDAMEPSLRVHQEIVRQIRNTVIRACLASNNTRQNVPDLQRVSAILTDWIMGTASTNPELFSVQFNRNLKMVAVGAPAQFYYPDAADQLGIPLQVPIHGEVANAIGAVVSSIVQRKHLTITQPTQSVFRVHCKNGAVDFQTSARALAFAETAVTREAKAKAYQAGAAEVELAITHHKISVIPDDSSVEIFFECRVTATASGRPSAGNAVGTLDHRGNTRS